MKTKSLPPQTLVNSWVITASNNTLQQTQETHSSPLTEKTGKKQTNTRLLAARFSGSTIKNKIQNYSCIKITNIHTIGGNVFTVWHLVLSHSKYRDSALTRFPMTLSCSFLTNKQTKHCRETKTYTTRDLWPQKGCLQWVYRVLNGNAKRERASTDCHQLVRTNQKPSWSGCEIPSGRLFSIGGECNPSRRMTTEWAECHGDRETCILPYRQSVTRE